MAKVKFNKLTLGHPLTAGDVWDNLSQCATALSGNIAAEQREEDRSIFTFALQRVRCGFDRFTEGDTPSTDFTLDWHNESGTKRLKFFLPPLQEYFDSNLVSDLNTPDIVLESISISFDNVNQQYPINIDTGTPNSADTFDQDFEVQIRSGSFVGQVTIPKVALNISNNEIINRPNPTVSADIGGVIDPYAELEITVRSPINSQPAAGRSNERGIDNMVIRASFSAPIVQRDTAAYSVQPQNDRTGSATARSFATNTLSVPAAGSLIKAGDRTSASTDGVQDAFEQLDRAVRDKLKGGLNRMSEVVAYSESVLEDQGYFCISIPLFNYAENNWFNGHHNAAAVFAGANTIDGYKRPSTLRGVNAFMDRAVIPITAPGTLHHVGVFYDGFQIGGASKSIYEMRMDLGVAIGCAPNSAVDSYTQIVQVAERNVTSTAATEYSNHFFAPIAYSTAGGAPALGSGYVTQGRPFFFGRQIDLTGGVLRENVANPANPAAAEAAPATDGTEQFIEVRCNLYQYDTSAPGYIGVDAMPAAASPADAFQWGGWSGVVVCLYGKMALVE